jgi:hypothetical protein
MRAGNDVEKNFQSFFRRQRTIELNVRLPGVGERMKSVKGVTPIPFGTNQLFEGCKANGPAGDPNHLPCKWFNVPMNPNSSRGSLEACTLHAFRALALQRRRRDIFVEANG